MTDMEIVNRNEKMLEFIQTSDNYLKSHLEALLELRTQIHNELNRIQGDVELADWKQMLEECRKHNEEKISCLMMLYATDYTPVKAEQSFILD